MHKEKNVVNLVLFSLGNWSSPRLNQLLSLVMYLVRGVYLHESYKN